MSFEDKITTVSADLKELEYLYNVNRDQLQEGGWDGPLKKSAKWMSGRLEVVMSSIMGIVRGYKEEMSRASKHLDKSREVLLQSFGDFTVGKETDLFAKTVQVKSSTGSTKNDVDSLISNAAFQISGGSGEVPRKWDRRIIDVAIANPLNTWPFTPTEKWDRSLKVIIARQEEAISRCASVKGSSKGKGRGKGITEACEKWLSNVDTKRRPKKKTVLRFNEEAGVNSTKMEFGNGKILNYLTVKVRFTFGREVVIDGVKERLLAAIFMVIKVDGKISCGCVAYRLEGQSKDFIVPV